MSDRTKDQSAEPREWLIRKRGYYYRPNRAGYTAAVAEAGRYTEAEAKNEAALDPWHMTALHQSEVDAGCTVTSNQQLAATLRILASGYSTELGRDAILSAAQVVERTPDETSVTNSPLAQAVLDRVVGANLGIFLTSAVDHIENGGNLASAEVELTDGTKVELRVSRVNRAGNHAPSCAAHDGKRCNCGVGSPVEPRETPAPLAVALAHKVYVTSERHLSGYRLILGFETLSDVQAAHTEVIHAGSPVEPRAPTELPESLRDPIRVMNMIDAMKIAEGVFDQYRVDQPKWWRRMDGTPILNDLVVRMAKAFVITPEEPKAGILLYKCGKCGTPMRCGPTQWEYQCECNTENGSEAHNKGE